MDNQQSSELLLTKSQ